MTKMAMRTAPSMRLLKIRCNERVEAAGDEQRHDEEQQYAEPKTGGDSKDKRDFGSSWPLSPVVAFSAE